MEVSRNEIMMRRALFAPFILQDLKREQANLIGSREVSEVSREQTCELTDTDCLAEDSFLTSGDSAAFVQLETQIDEQYLGILDPKMLSKPNMLAKNASCLNPRMQFKIIPGSEDLDWQQTIDVGRTGLSKVVAIMILERNNIPKKTNTIISFYKKKYKKSWFYEKFGPKPMPSEERPVSPVKKAMVKLLKQQTLQEPSPLSQYLLPSPSLLVTPETHPVLRAVEKVSSPQEEAAPKKTIVAKLSGSTEGSTMLRQSLKSPKPQKGLLTSSSKTSLKALRLEDVFRKSTVVEPQTHEHNDASTITNSPPLEDSLVRVEQDAKPDLYWQLKSPLPTVVSRAAAIVRPQQNESSPTKVSKSISDVLSGLKAVEEEEEPPMKKIDFFGRRSLTTFNIEDNTDSTESASPKERLSTGGIKKQSTKSILNPDLRHSQSSTKMKGIASVVEGIKGSRTSPRKNEAFAFGIAQVIQAIPTPGNN